MFDLSNLCVKQMFTQFFVCAFEGQSLACACDKTIYCPRLHELAPYDKFFFAPYIYKTYDICRHPLPPLPHPPPRTAPPSPC